MWDPVTNQNATQLTLTPPAENVHIEAGYDGYGQALVNTYSLNGAPNPETDLADETRTVKAVGAGHHIYDGYGQSLPVSVPSGAPGNSPMEGLAYEGAQVTDGVLLDATADEAVRSYDHGASFSIVGYRGTATKISDDRLRIVTPLSDLAAPGSAGPRLSRSASDGTSSSEETGAMTVPTPGAMESTSWKSW